MNNCGKGVMSGQQVVVPMAYLVYLRNCSNGNIDMIYSLPETNSYEIRCKTCQSTFNWVHLDYNKMLGVDLEVLEKYCEGHKHLPTVVQEEVEYDDYTKSFGLPATPSVSYSYKYTTSLPPHLSFTTTTVPNNTTGQYVSPTDLGNFQVQQPGYTLDKVQLDQMQMKKIWQWSNFKVDMQVRVYNNIVTEVRLLCNECGQFQPLSWYKISNSNDPVWEAIEAWSRKHGECGSYQSIQEKNISGRKFKY